MKWLPRILALVMLWGGILATMLFIDPELIKDLIIPGTYLPFFILLQITLWYSLRKFWISLTICLGIFLTSLHLMHWGLALVLLLTLVMESWYTYIRHEKINPANEQKDRKSGI